MPDPHGPFLYFAYGSNMLTQRLTARAPSATAVGIAYVEGYRLTFDKVSTDGSGKCDIEATGNTLDRVWGILFWIAAAEAANLDDAEGLGRGYRKGELQVKTNVAQIRALTYFATSKDPARRPYHWYKDFVLAGAIEHSLPSDYIAAIGNVQSEQDPNASRRAENEALLAPSLTKPGYVIGVDGCRAGWLVCRYEVRTQRISFEIQKTFETLANASGLRYVAIDIPIGLTEDGRPRGCDIDARRILGKPRASSVFPAPARHLLDACNYREACLLSRDLRGKAISQQAFGILRKVAEVDRVMTPELQNRIFEVHPEVCFWSFHRSAMIYAKKTSEGYEERRRLLTDRLNCALPDRKDVRRLVPGIEPDDLLDSVVAAVTANKIVAETAERLPGTSELDAKGLRMEMLF